MRNLSQDQNRPYTSLQTVININDSWVIDGDNTYIGTRTKYHVEAPSAIEPPVVPCHEYIFKISKEHRQSEIWAEILASYIGGDLLKLDVHRTYIAQMTKFEDAPYGVLIESFLKEPYFGGNPIPKFGRRTSLIHGGDIMKAYMPEFDLSLGKQTCIQLLRESTQAPTRFQIGKPTFIRYWADLFAFDMLINNGDRHHENWGLVPFGWRRPSEQSRDCLLYTSPSPRDRTRSRMPSSA